MIRTFVIAVVLALSSGYARAQATSFDAAPITWGETDVRYTTVCAKRWHAIRIRDTRTRAVNMGLGAEDQIREESRAVFSGAADCVTAQIVYRPLAHADVILDALTWVQMPTRDGPVPCFKDQRCRWMIQSQNFVEAEVEIDGVAHPGAVYVATPRPVQPARIGAPPVPVN